MTTGVSVSFSRSWYDNWVIYWVIGLLVWNEQCHVFGFSDLDSCQRNDNADILAEDFILSSLLSRVGGLSDLLEVYWGLRTHALGTSTCSVATSCSGSQWEFTQSKKPMTLRKAGCMPRSPMEGNSRSYAWICANYVRSCGLAKGFKCIKLFASWNVSHFNFFFKCGFMIQVQIWKQHGPWTVL